MESITCWISLNRHSDLPWNMDRGQPWEFHAHRRSRHPWHEFDRSVIFLFQFSNALSAVIRKYANSLPIVYKHLWIVDNLQTIRRMPLSIRSSFVFYNRSEFASSSISSLHVLVSIFVSFAATQSSAVDGASTIVSNDPLRSFHTSCTPE